MRAQIRESLNKDKAAYKELLKNLLIQVSNFVFLIFIGSHQTYGRPNLHQVQRVRLGYHQFYPRRSRLTVQRDDRLTGSEILRKGTRGHPMQYHHRYQVLGEHWRQREYWMYRWLQVVCQKGKNCLLVDDWWPHWAMFPSSYPSDQIHVVPINEKG